jgi:hypothetical protein
MGSLAWLGELIDLLALKIPLTRHRWRWLFLLEGAASFLLGIAAVFFLPDFPGNATGSAKWLFTEEERRVSALRIKLDSVSTEEANSSVLYGLKLAVTDYKVWMFVGLPDLSPAVDFD